MSVGAGSIKRAANAVNTANAANAGGVANVAGAENKELENMGEVTTRAESIIQKAESRLAARKAAEGKPVGQRGSASMTGKSQTVNRVTSGRGQTETKSNVTEGAVEKTETTAQTVTEDTEETADTAEKEQAIETAEKEMGAANESVISAQNSENIQNRGCIIYGIGQELPVYLL